MVGKTKPCTDTFFDYNVCIPFLRPGGSAGIWFMTVCKTPEATDERNTAVDG